MKNNNYKVYVHKVDTEEGPVYYTGVTNNISQRWRPSAYKGTSLYEYINKYGWQNIQHLEVANRLSYEKARKIEDLLICCYRKFGVCINRQRSGLIYIKDPVAYNKYLIENNKEYARKRKEYSRNRARKYYAMKKATDPEYRNHMNEYARNRYANDSEYADKRKENARQYRINKKINNPEWIEKERERHRKEQSTIEGKIYKRVHSFNHNHPDRITETPLEAKHRYLETGYIPDYIKNDDLMNKDE